MAAICSLIWAVATKATKYASLDPAKELAFLPLSSEERYKSKAAVDIVGARMGKGGAALFNIFVLNWAMGKETTVEKSTMWTSLVAIGLMIVVWVGSTLYLAGAITKKGEQKMLKEQFDKNMEVTMQGQTKDTPAQIGEAAV